MRSYWLIFIFKFGFYSFLIKLGKNINKKIIILIKWSSHLSWAETLDVYKNSKMLLEKLLKIASLELYQLIADI